MKKTVTWILIADGTQARVLEHNGPGKGLATIKDLDWSITPLQSKDIDTDGYGRGPTGGAMSSGNDSSKHREAEFVKDVAAQIDAKAHQGAFALSERTKKAIIAELDKDLTNVPTAQLDKHFDGIFAV